MKTFLRTLNKKERKEVAKIPIENIGFYLSPNTGDWYIYIEACDTCFIAAYFGSEDEAREFVTSGQYLKLTTLYRVGEDLDV